MATKPPYFPLWGDTNGTQEPSMSKKLAGWLQEKPPFQFFNWLQSGFSSWLSFLRNRFNEIINSVAPTSPVPRIQVITWDADFVTGNGITIRVDDQIVEENFDTDHATTINNIATNLQTNVASIASAVAAPVPRTITITSSTTAVPDFLSILVQGGASQPNQTLVTTQSGRLASIGIGALADPDADLSVGTLKANLKYLSTFNDAKGYVWSIPNTAATLGWRKIATFDDIPQGTKIKIGIYGRSGLDEIPHMTNLFLTKESSNDDLIGFWETNGYPSDQSGLVEVAYVKNDPSNFTLYINHPVNYEASIEATISRGEITNFNTAEVPSGEVTIDRRRPPMFPSLYQNARDLTLNGTTLTQRVIYCKNLNVTATTIIESRTIFVEGDLTLDPGVTLDCQPLYLNSNLNSAVPDNNFKRAWWWFMNPAMAQGVNVVAGGFGGGASGGTTPGGTAFVFNYNANGGNGVANGGGGGGGGGGAGGAGSSAGGFNALPGTGGMFGTGGTGDGGFSGGGEGGNGGEMIFIIVRGKVNIGAGATIKAEGELGKDANPGFGGLGGGGGGGGGILTLIAYSGYVNNGSISCNGGSGGNAAPGGVNGAGGGGGAIFLLANRGANPQGALNVSGGNGNNNGASGVYISYNMDLSTDPYSLLGGVQDNVNLVTNNINNQDATRVAAKLLQFIEKPM
jgi:hypothetical protein